MSALSLIVFGVSALQLVRVGVSDRLSSTDALSLAHGFLGLIGAASGVVAQVGVWVVLPWVVALVVRVWPVGVLVRAVACAVVVPVSGVLGGGMIAVMMAEGLRGIVVRRRLAERPPMVLRLAR